MNMIRPGLAAMVWLCGTLVTTSAAAPATNAPARPQPDRWLLIVDTSAAMKHRAAALEGVIGELLLSGMNGQMKTGDELGIWTFNKELIAGVAPMQIWDPARSNVISGRSSRFVGRQEFKDKARLDKVLTALPRVISESRRLTILIFSDGAQKFSGTPFDDAINTAYAEHQPALARTRMPLVTVLRSERGKYIGQTVSFAPWPIEYPAFAEEPKPPAATVAPAPVKPAEPRKSIIIGSPKKSESTNVLVETVRVVSPSPAQIVTPVEPTPTPQPKLEPASAAVPEKVVVEAPPAPALTATNPPAIRPAPDAAAAASPPAPVETISARKWPLILGIGCMWVAIVAAWFLSRRSRRASASLITRSLDHQQK